MPYQPTWQNPYLQPYQSQGLAQQVPYQSQYQQPVNGVIKVNGRDSAMQYQLPPNSTSPALFDNGGRMFYVVSTDGTGMKTVETFDFSPHKDEPVSIDGAEFVSKQEYDKFVAKVSAALEALNGVHGPVSASTAGAPDRFEGTNVSNAPDDARRRNSVNSAGQLIEQSKGRTPQEAFKACGYDFDEVARIVNS